MKTKIKLLRVRIAIAWRVLTKPNEHWFIIFMQTDQLRKTLEFEDVESIEYTTHMMREYNIRQLCYGISKDFDAVKEYEAFKNEFKLTLPK